MSARNSRTYRRRLWLVNPSYQYRIVGVLLVVLFLMTVGALLSVYVALWLTLRAFELAHDALAVSLLSTAGIITTFELLLIAPLIIWVGIRLSHRVAGPLVRINAALQQMAGGDFDVSLRLRKGDSLTEIAESVNTLALSLRTRAPLGQRVHTHGGG